MCTKRRVLEMLPSRVFTSLYTPCVQELPCASECYFSLIAECLLNVASHIAAALTEQMAASDASSFLDFPLLLLVLEKGWVIFGRAGHHFG